MCLLCGVCSGLSGTREAAVGSAGSSAGTAQHRRAAPDMDVYVWGEGVAGWVPDKMTGSR